MLPIIIQGSSRSFGNTWHAVQTIIEGYATIPIVDLNTLALSAYDYENRNQNDDYLPLMEKVAQHNLIVLATPVYWYTMSAIMKVFIDRLSDLTSIRKDIGRKLRGKDVFIVASFSTSLPKGFAEPFEQTCHYMGMNYKGCSFIYHGADSQYLESNPISIEKARTLLFG